MRGLQGTRQKSSRNFGIRLAPTIKLFLRADGSRREAWNENTCLHNEKCPESQGRQHVLMHMMYNSAMRCGWDTAHTSFHQDGWFDHVLMTSTNVFSVVGCYKPEATTIERRERICPFCKNRMGRKKKSPGHEVTFPCPHYASSSKFPSPNSSL